MNIEINDLESVYDDSKPNMPSKFGYLVSTEDTIAGALDTALGFPVGQKSITRFTGNFLRGDCPGLPGLPGVRVHPGLLRVAGRRT